MKQTYDVFYVYARKLEKLHSLTNQNVYDSLRLELVDS